MVVIRPTASLAKRMKVKIQATTEKSNTQLGDWYAIDFNLGRMQFILCVNENTRLGVVIHAAPYLTFPARLQEELKILLLDLKINKTIINDELVKMKQYTLAKTASRSVLGTIKEYLIHIEAHHSIGHLDLDDLQRMSLQLSTIPSLALRSFPQDLAYEAFSPSVIPDMDFQ